MLVQDEPYLVERKWGYFLQFTENEKSTVKLLHVKKGSMISLQYHENRSEQWYLLSGRIWITKGILSRMMMPGESVTIDRMEKHKLEGVEDSVVLEISKGYFDESDIVRL